MCSIATGRTILCLFNFIFWVTGLSLIVLGIWISIDNSLLHYFFNIHFTYTDSIIYWSALILSIVGVFIFIIAFIGCCGVVQTSRIMLLLYSTIIIILIIAKIVLIIFAVVYYDQIKLSFGNLMSKYIRTEYKVQGEYMKEITNVHLSTWDLIQIKLECCGDIDSNIYEGSIWQNMTKEIEPRISVPLSCCTLPENMALDKLSISSPLNYQLCQSEVKTKSELNYVHKKGCNDAVAEWISQNRTLIIATLCGIFFIEIINLIYACFLNRINNPKEYF
ncbi:Tetraspanin-17 [Intoshia linei]|uniref:Tetraspanin n=1 Tax=Intoshia linei TaxID=1819745 RepID=A0A177AZD1_9BILA|nr:Tetraspanin-17 [Intoshia linei]